MITEQDINFDKIFFKSKNLESIAIETEECSVSYKELYKRVTEVSELVKDKTPNRTVVAVEGHSSIEMVVNFFAIIRSGRGVLLIDKSWSQEWKDMVMSDSQPYALFTDNIERLAGQTLISLPNSPKLLPSNTAFIIYSSGTTGKPKGSINTVEGLSNLFHAYSQVFSVDKTDVVLQFSSPSFDAWISDVCLALTNGAKLVIPNYENRLPGTGLEKCVKNHNITVVTLPPSVLHHCHPEDFLTVNTLIVVGERCSKVLVEKWLSGRNMYNAYGPSETSVCTSVHKISNADKSPSIGCSIPGVKIWLEDEDGKVIEDVGRGQLVVGGNGVGLGYLDREELTKEKFSLSQKLFYTGDIVYRDTDYLLYYEGRLDNQVKINGVRIELDRVEELLETHKQVSSAVAVKGSFHGRDVVIAFVVPQVKDLNEINLRKDLIAVSKSNLPANVSLRIMFINELPLRGSGKVDKKYLLTQYQENKVPILNLDEKTLGLEEKICNIFSNDLEIETFSPSDDYFLMGGDSLGMIRCLSEIETCLGKKFVPSIGMTYSTPKSLAEALTNSLDTYHIEEKALELKDLPDLDLSHVKQNPNGKTGVFLTGATGLLGAYVLKEILDTSESVVRCLVRANSKDEAFSRVKKNLEKHNLWNEAYNDKLICYLGNLSKEHFALDSREYTAIVENIGYVYHLAASVSWVQTYKSLKSVNVTGTVNAIRMCADSGAKLVYVSSIGVYHTKDWKSLSKFDESNISNAGDHRLGYLRSKWASEHLVIKAMDAGISCYVIRPPFICSGVSHTNQVAQSDFLQSKILSCIELGCIPEDGFHLDIYPADLLASGIVLIVKNDKFANRMFNFSNPSKLIWPEIKDVFADLGYDFPLTSYKNWLDKINNLSNSMSQHISFIGTSSEQDVSIYEHSHGEWPYITENNTVEALGNRNVPPVQQLIKKYIPSKVNN